MVMPQPQIQVLPIPLGGIDESAPASLIEPGKMTSVINGTMLAAGSWEPRPGFEALSNNARVGTITLIKAFSRGEELYGLATDGYMYSWSASESRWEKIDQYAEAQCVNVWQGERGLVDANVATSPYCDAVLCGQYLVTVQGMVKSTGADTLIVRVTDIVTGCRMPVLEISYYGTGARLLTYSSRVYIIYAHDNQTVVGRILDTATAPLTWGAEITIANDMSTDHPIFEGAVPPDSSEVFVVYNQATQVGEIVTITGTLLKLDQNLTLSSSRQVTKFALTSWGIIADKTGANMVYIACDDHAGAGVVAYGIVYTTMVLSWGHTVVDGTTDVYDGADSRVRRIAISPKPGVKMARIYWDLIQAPAATHPDPCVRSKRITDAGVASTPVYTENVMLLSQPQYNATLGIHYAWMSLAEKSWHEYTTTAVEPITPSTTPTTDKKTLPRLQGSAHLVAYDLATITRGPGRVCCRLWPLTVADLQAARAVSFGSEYDVVAIPRLSEAEHGTDPGFTVAQIRFFDPRDIHAMQYGPSMILTGGVPQMFDGNKLVEIGWDYYPRIGAVTPKNDAGSLTNSATYSYKAVYTWIDNCGNRHYSASSLPRSVTLGAADDTVDVQVDNLTLTTRQDFDDQIARVEIEIYRTLNAGTEYYLVKRLTNDPTNPSQTYTDTTSDTTLQWNAMILDRGGRYAAGCTPPLKHIVAHQQRLFGVRADDPCAIVFGHPTPRGEAPRIPDGWEVRSGDGGEYTALGSLDDRLLAFQSSGIDCVWGSGPNEQGKGPIYPEPQICSRVAGCDGPHMICKYPQGYFFIGKSGAWSVDASLQPQYRSGPIQNTLNVADQSADVRAVHLDEARYRLLISADVSSVPTLLVWHYRFDAWSTWRPLDTAGNTPSYLSIASQTQSGYPRLVLVGTGRALRERISSHVEADTSKVVMQLVTGWLAPAGLQSWSDAWKLVVLGTYREKASVTAKLYYDYASATTSTHAYTSANVLASKLGSRIQLLVQPQYTEVESVQLELTVTPDSTNARSLRIESVAIETATKGIAMPNLPEEARA